MHLLALLLACAGTDSAGDSPIDTDTDVAIGPWSPPACAAEPCALLSDWRLFGDLSALTPALGVLPYEVNAPLWSDDASKDRLIAIPEGTFATFDPAFDASIGFPAGAVLVKTFSFAADKRVADGPERRIETRLFVRGDADWTGVVYLWNADQTDAALLTTGETVDVTWIDEAGADRTAPYVVPAADQCTLCHSADFVPAPLGTTAIQLDRGDQLARLAAAGLFDAALPASDGVRLADPADSTIAIESRARAWLHANCAACHRAGGGAKFTQLFLSADVTDPVKLGVCKAPSSGGPFGDQGELQYDVVPGNPEASILRWRVTATGPGQKMPPLPNLTADPLGIELIDGWIAAMAESDCVTE